MCAHTVPHTRPVDLKRMRSVPSTTTVSPGLRSHRPRTPGRPRARTGSGDSARRPRGLERRRPTGRPRARHRSRSRHRPGARGCPPHHRLRRPHRFAARPQRWPTASCGRPDRRQEASWPAGHVAAVSRASRTGTVASWGCGEPAREILSGRARARGWDPDIWCGRTLTQSLPPSAAFRRLPSRSTEHSFAGPGGAGVASDRRQPHAKRWLPLGRRLRALGAGGARLAGGTSARAAVRATVRPAVGGRCSVAAASLEHLLDVCAGVAGGMRG